MSAPWGMPRTLVRMCAPCALCNPGPDPSESRPAALRMVSLAHLDDRLPWR